MFLRSFLCASFTSCFPFQFSSRFHFCDVSQKRIHFNKKRAMEEDATREAVYSVIKQADEDKSGPLDLPAIVERCNVALLGKRKKLSDKEANGHIRRLVKAQKIVLVKQAQKGTYYSTEVLPKLSFPPPPQKTLRISGGLHIVAGTSTREAEEGGTCTAKGTHTNIPYASCS